MKGGVLGFHRGAFPGPWRPALRPRHEWRVGSAHNKKYRPSGLCVQTDALRLNNINNLVCRIWPTASASRAACFDGPGATTPSAPGTPRSQARQNVRPSQYLRTNIERRLDIEPNLGSNRCASAGRVR